VKFLEGDVSKLIKKNRTILHYLEMGGNIRDRNEFGIKEVKEFEGQGLAHSLSPSSKAIS